MRINEISHGPVDAMLPFDPQKIVAYLRKNAAPWLELTHNGATMMYRGLHNGGDPKNIFTITTRADRRPLTTSRFFHRVMNAMLTAMGSKTTRSNSVFMSPVFKFAQFYGMVYVAIPLGPVHYVWSPKFEDMVSVSIYELLKYLSPSGLKHHDANMAKRHPNDKEIFFPETGIFKWVDDPAYLDPTSWDPKKLQELFTVDNDFDGAIATKHEMAVQCVRTLYIDADYYKQYIRPLLIGDVK